MAAALGCNSRAGLPHESFSFSGSLVFDQLMLHMHGGSTHNFITDAIEDAVNVALTKKGNEITIDAKIKITASD